ncbi:MAG: efflux transporter outer membrane subunit [Bdellovibrionales bacterium]|nr:efflux transporter outer membrane subunit [Bdellovibrionales bacterium]
MFHRIHTSRAPLFSVFLSIVFFGCSVGPDYIPPDPSLPSGYAQPELGEDLNLARYWELLGDPVLDGLIERGGGSNLSLQEAVFRLKESFSLYGARNSDFFPELGLVSTIQKRRRSEGVASAISSPNNDFVSVGGALSWEIDIFGRLRRLRESAQASAEASLEDFRGTLVSLQAEIALSYIRYRTFQAEIDLTNENIRSQKESFELAKGRFTAGIAPELDLRQAESNLNETQAALPALRRSIAVEKNRLAVLLGLFPQEVEPLLNAVQAIPPFPKVESTTLPLDVLRQRPDIRRAEREFAAQHALIGAVEAEWYPIVSLPGTISFEALNNLENAFRGSSLAYTVGPSVTLNLLDFGRRRHTVEAQEYRTSQFESRYRQTVLEAVQEVENALATFREEKIRTKYLRQSVEASRRSTELVKSLYVSGLTDFQNVLDSERTLFSQQISLAESSGDVFQAFVSLYRALGGGWQKQENPMDTNTETGVAGQDTPDYRDRKPS